MRRVLVLGGQGMLGSAVSRVLSDVPGVSVTATSRDGGSVQTTDHWALFDAATDDPYQVVLGHDWVVNCLGRIRHVIDEADPQSVEAAWQINAYFPQTLWSRSMTAGARVLQIATDCVYSGNRGRYTETDLADPVDVYGKTKLAGEVLAPGFYNVRCSIVGREVTHRRSLLEWLLSHEDGALVPGYVDHRWNGVTTLAFARVVAGIVTADLDLPPLQHLVPADDVSKCELLSLMTKAYGRDLRIDPVESQSPVDRTLSTVRPEANRRLWSEAGYETVPTVSAMLTEMASA